MIITIDGPSGSGKSTAARNLARILKIACLDTGATYRAVTLRAMRAGVDMSDEQAMLAVARDMDLQMTAAPHGLRVLLDGDDVTDAIRTAEVTDNAKYAASSPLVRRVLTELQRKIGIQLGSFVTEGRDQGSAVFPDADIKFFLVAEPDARAERRVGDFAKAGEQLSQDQVHQAMTKRDESDRSRSVGPLIEPEGAIRVDTTHNTMDETAAQLMRHVEAVK